MKTLKRSIIALLLGALAIWGVWSQLLTQVSELPRASGSVLLLGRIVADESERLHLDDGTGVARLEWVGGRDARPRPGMVVVLHADIRADSNGARILEGTSRFAISTSETSLLVPD